MELNSNKLSQAECALPDIYNTVTAALGTGLSLYILLWTYKPSL